MAIPTSITDLDVNEALNSPAGSDNVGGTLDNFLRAHAAIIKRQFSKGANINSASTMTIPPAGSFFDVVNVISAINAFSSNFDGRIVYLKFADGITLNHSSSLMLPAGVSITTRADDIACFVNESSGVWRCLSYPRYTDAGHPGTDEPTITWPFMPWADTGNMLLKRRDAANSAWIVESALFTNGKLIGVQIFTASGTYTPTAGTQWVEVEGVGAGGAGGGVPAGGASTRSAGGGGGAGAYGLKRITSGFSGVAVTVGLGGSPSGGNPGGNGGTTSFGTEMTLTGGLGGAVAGARNDANSPSVCGVGRSGGAASGADVGVDGGGGRHGVAYGPAVGGSACGGAGGSCRFGEGGLEAPVNGTSVLGGNPGTGYGSGGGGAVGVNNGVVTSGGSGAPGILIIYEYA